MTTRRKTTIKRTTKTTPKTTTTTTQKIERIPEATVVNICGINAFVTSHQGNTLTCSAIKNQKATTATLIGKTTTIQGQLFAVESAESSKITLIQEPGQ